MPEHVDQTRSARPFGLSRRNLALIGAGLLAFGGGAGAIVMAETRPDVSMAPATPVAIRSLSSEGIVTIRGRVADIYGNKFILADATGRALVDTGREGDGRQLVAAGEPVTVQGRFDRGSVRAAFLVGPDAKVLALGPLGGPPHGRRGPGDDFDRGPGAPPPGLDGAACAAVSPPPVAPDRLPAAPAPQAER